MNKRIASSKQLIIVTGGAGFVGSCLLSSLNQRGEDQIVVVDSLGETEKWKNLLGKDYVDYLDKHSFLEKIKSGSFSSYPIKAIFHLGACSRTTEKNADYLMLNNTYYTRDLALYCLEHKIPFLYASSAATYGQGESGYSDDEQSLFSLRPSNMYGYSKHLFDLMAKKQGWFKKIAGFKFFNVFGPNEDHKKGMTSIVYNAYHQILQTGELKLFKSDKKEYENGEQKRDFVYVKDVVNVLLWFYDHPELTGLYNLGYGRATSWNTIAGYIFEAMGITPKISYIEMPEILKGKYQYYTCSDMKKLKAVCPITFTALKDSVKDYVQNYLYKGDRL